MNAEKLVEMMDKQLIGHRVLTQPIGDWPGGLATVVEVRPDPNAPEIVMNVIKPDWEGAMGIFDHEEVQLVPYDEPAVVDRLKFEAWKLIRLAVRRFAVQMELRLRDNDHKEGWSNEPLPDLWYRLEEETKELFQEICDRKPGVSIRHEACDVANFAMMIFDNTLLHDQPDKFDLSEYENQIASAMGVPKQYWAFTSPRFVGKIEQRKDLPALSEPDWAWLHMATAAGVFNEDHFIVFLDVPDPRTIQYWWGKKIGETVEVPYYGSCTLLRVEYRGACYEAGTERPLVCKRIEVEVKRQKASP